MTWTYAGNPATNTTATVRFLVGDTVSTDPLATDEEIAWALTVYSDVYKAAALVAENIATKFATMKVSVKIGPIAEDYGNRAEFYAKRAKELKNNASSKTTMDVYSAPVDYNGIEKVASFTIGMTDIRGLSNVTDPKLVS
jgi:hypothetical protein